MPFLFGPQKNIDCVNGLSFLYKIKDKPIYFMDNHGAALWCWIQELDTNKKYNLIHIDRHYDVRHGDGLVEKKLEKICEDNISIKNLKIETFIDLKVEMSDFFKKEHPIMRYDDFLLLFIKLYKKYIGQLVFSSMNDVESPGDSLSQSCTDIKENILKTKEDLFNYLDINFNKLENWIVDIDLDYFTNGEEIIFNKKEICTILDKFKGKNIKCITVASSPNQSFGDNCKSLKFIRNIYNYINYKT